MPVGGEAPLDLARIRARRWWIDRTRVRTIRRAGLFVADVDAALLIPVAGVELPSLWEVVVGPDVEAFSVWNADAELVWSWKDELPTRRWAWYGKLARGRGTFLSPALLADLYAGRGAPDDYRGFDLGPDAARIAAVLEGGARPQSVLREEVGLAGKAGKGRFDRAMGELYRHLLVTHAGVWEQDRGWPAAMIELTCRMFDVGGGDPVAAAGRFLATTLRTTPRGLGQAFAWPVGEARTALDALTGTGGAAKDGDEYLAGKGRPLGGGKNG